VSFTDQHEVLGPAVKYNCAYMNCSTVIVIKDVGEVLLATKFDSTQNQKVFCGDVSAIYVWMIIIL